MKKLKKLLCLGLAFLMVLSMAACQGEKKEEKAPESSAPAASSSAAVESSAVEEVDPYEATEFPETVSVFCLRRPAKIKEGEDGYNGSASFRMIEEMTGTHVEWEAVDDFDQKFQLELTSEDYCDIMIGNWKNIGDEQAVEDGVILNLSDYKEYMPNFMAYLKANPEVAKSVVTPEGEITCIPFIRRDPELCIYYGPVMRLDWLEKLNLDIPTDAESLYDVLVAFKTQDPNGNGQQDEIPMSGVKAGNLTRLLPLFGTNHGFYLEDGKVQYGAMTENFDEGMAYIAKLYAEGLIDEEYLMLDRSKLVGKITNHQVGFAFEYQPSAISRTMAEDPEFNFFGIPNFENQDGVKVTADAAYISQVVGYWAAVTTACENPEATIKWLDNFFSEEAIEYMNYGEEGVTFNKVGDEYVYTDYMMKNPDGRTVDEMLEWEIASISGLFPQLQTWGSYAQKLTEAGSGSIEVWADVDTSMILPKVTLTAEEQETVTNTMAQVTTIVDEKIDKIIMGQESVDVMDEVREQIKKLGIEDVLAIYQAAYERYDSVALAE